MADKLAELRAICRGMSIDELGLVLRFAEFLTSREVLI